MFSSFLFYFFNHSHTSLQINIELKETKKAEKRKKKECEKLRTRKRSRFTNLARLRGLAILGGRAVTTLLPTPCLPPFNFARCPYHARLPSRRRGDTRVSSRTTATRAPCRRGYTTHRPRGAFCRTFHSHLRSGALGQPSDHSLPLPLQRSAPRPLARSHAAFASIPAERNGAFPCR